MNPTDGTDNDRLNEAFLTSRLDELKGELASVSAPDVLEARLVSAFRSRKQQLARPRLWWMPPLALAATVAMVSWTMRAPVVSTDPLPPGSPLGQEFKSGGPGRGSVAQFDAGPFLALRPLERIALEPGVTVVATEFPRALLADWGLPVSPERAGEPVRAEMLYSSRGEPIAVRLLN